MNWEHGIRGLLEKAAVVGKKTPWSQIPMNVPPLNLLCDLGQVT